MGCALVGGEVREGLSKEVTFQWRPQQSKGGSCDNTRGKHSPDRGPARAKAMNRRMLGELQNVREAGDPRSSK